jgi:hypothetical protein
MGNTKSTPKQLEQAGSSGGNSRYEVCELLAGKQILNVIWFEDLLALHGSDTQVWDLHLLVEEPRTAAVILLDSGYKETPPETKFENDPEFSSRSIRIARSQSSTGVVLHSAREWYYQLDDGVDDFLPPLHSFLDSMIEFWLNISSQDYLDRLGFALYIGCLINYCYYLQNSEGGPVKSLAYAEKLKPEHREVHYNITSTNPKEESFTTTSRHMYHVRRSREIKEGVFVPRPYEKGVFRPPLTTVSEQEG